jgi:hypothetical protein
MSVAAFFKELDNFPDVAKWFDRHPHIFEALSRLEHSESLPDVVKLLDLYPQFNDVLREHKVLREVLFEIEPVDHSIFEPADGHLLALVYGDPGKHANLDTYLIDAVQQSREDAKELHDNNNESEALIVDTEEGPAYTVGDQPLTFEEEAKFVDKIRDADTIHIGEQETGYDVVKKARHYNVHPSGIECIELAEKLSFNIGNAFKYVFRRDDKGDTLLNLHKAEYYLSREIKNWQATFNRVPAYTKNSYIIHPLFTAADEEKARKLVRDEPNETVASFYFNLFQNPAKLSTFGIGSLLLAHRDLRKLIEHYESTKNSC